MRWPVSVLVAVAGLITTSELAHAQPVQSGAPAKEVVASGVLMQPLGDFQRALQTIGIGGGYHYLIALASGPVSIGVDSQLLFYPPPVIQVDEMILTAHGLVRLRRRTGSRRPYAEAVVGVKGFSHEQNTRIGGSSYGVGAGMQFPFAQTRTGTAKQEVVEIGVRYLRGGRARVNDQRFTSSTHAVMVHIGWGLRF